MTRSRKRIEKIGEGDIEGRKVDYLRFPDGSVRPNLRLISFRELDEELYVGHTYGPNTELGHFERFFTMSDKVYKERVPRNAISYETELGPKGSNYFNFNSCVDY